MLMPVTCIGLLSVALFIPMAAVAQVVPGRSADSSFQSLNTAERVHAMAGKVDSAAYRMAANKDSLLAMPGEPRQALLAVGHRADSLHHILQAKLDSLLQLPVQDSLLIAPLQKLASQTDSLRDLIASKKNKIQTPQALKNTEDRIQQVGSKINAQISALRSKGIPTGSLEKLQIPSIPGPNINGITDLKIPSASIPQPALAAGNLTIPTVDTALPNTSLQLPQAGTAGLPNPLAEVPGNMKNAKIPEISGVSGSQTEIENRIMETDEISDLKDVIDPAERAKRYYDPDVAKEEAVNKAKEAAVNHFAGHEKELEAAIQKLSELKAKFPDAEQTLDLFSKRQKQLAGVRFAERLVPGLTFQGYTQHAIGLDLNPQLAFRISYRWSAGAGWVERVAYNVDHRMWDHTNRIYGSRGFIHFKLRENFYLKGDAELMNAALHNPANNDEMQRRWIWNYLGGIKRDFQLSEKMKGNIQALYTVYRSNRQSGAYANAFQIRLGIDIPLKKAVSATPPEAD